MEGDRPVQTGLFFLGTVRKFMICLSLMPRSAAEGALLCRRRKEGVGAVEFRLDLLPAGEDPAGLFRGAGVPTIAACRSKREGGLFPGTEEERLGRLAAAASAGAAWVDVEYPCAGHPALASIPAGRRILSYHDLEGTPKDLEGWYRKMRAFPAYAYKLVTTARSPIDALEVLRFLRRRRRGEERCIAFAMGEAGLPSRILAPRFGSWLTYGSAEEERETAPGQLPAGLLKRVYRLDEEGTRADGPWYAVLGHPLGHSLSPAMHNRALREIGSAGIYFPVPCARLEEGIRFLREIGISGFNVTIPYKQEILARLDRVDGVARRVGAVNTVYLREGKWCGTNTDVTGIGRMIDRAVEAAGGGGASGQGAISALVLGAGGAARACVAALQDRGMSVSVSNRTDPKGEELARGFGCRYLPWEKRACHEGALWINATSCGMRGEELPLPAEALSPGHGVLDCVYRLGETALVRQARRLGCAAWGGEEMLVRQGAEAFRIWTGREPPVDAMREAVEEALA
jgi:3-dehydroquinate dehydratase/shikimate dehydrogenase